MKQLFIMCIIALSFLLNSCNNAKTEPTAGGANSDSTLNAASEQNKANTNLVFRGIETGDLSKMDNFVATDIVDHNMGGDVKGLDSVKKMLGDIHNHFTDYKMEIVADATKGDYHFSLIKTTGTTKDNSMGMPANTAFSSLTTGVERISNGKVQEHWRFVDPAEMMKMIHPASAKTAAHK